MEADVKAKIENFQNTRNQNPTFDFANLSDEDFDDLDVDPEDLKIGGKHKISLEHLNLPDWKLAVSQDRDQLQYLLDHAAPIHPGRDAKLLRLCDLFDARTRNGADMAHENDLLERAVESIKVTFGRRAAAALFAGRDGKLPSAQDTPASSADLELVTWLVIMGGKE